MASPPRSNRDLQPEDLNDRALDFDSPEAPRKNRLDGPIRGPQLGPFEFLRWSWRLLTSMRTAIVLLVLLAVASIPGSVFPQRSSDPNGVIQFERNDPDLFAIYDALQLFDTFTSVWFSSIYVLLFVSLIGCIIPRTIHHWRVLRSAPAEEPRAWNRLPVLRSVPIAINREAALASAEKALRRARFRVVRDGDSLRAEFGYLRETGNLIFHISLIGVLVSVGFASGFSWHGQRVIVEGQSFTNQLSSFDSFTPGRWFDETHLDPYALRLDTFTPEYVRDEAKDVWTPIDFTAKMTVTESTGSAEQELKVNSPLSIGDSEVYLLGNGFAPVITVRDPAGTAVFSQPVVFLSQDSNLTSIGVVKVPDGLSEQIGMQGFFYPSAVELDTGALSSDNPEPLNPTITFNVYKGDLGIDEGRNGNVFQLPTDDLTQLAGRHTGIDVVLTPGDVFEIPGGLGSIEFSGLTRFVGVEIRHDATQLGVAISIAFLVAGLLASLGTRRRRVWVRVASNGSELEWGAQSRGDDPGLEQFIDRMTAESAAPPRGKIGA